MDFSSDFNIPDRPSQIIESDSDDHRDGESNQSGIIKDESGSSSPIFRRCLKSSPVISGGKRKNSFEDGTHKARRSLNSDFFDRCESKLFEKESDENISIEDEEFLESEEVFESGQVLTESGSLASSEVVSSCQSSIGAQPQPIEDKRPLMTASTLMGELEEEDEVFQTSSTSDTPPDNILNSGKKRKLLKGGLAESLEQCLQQKSSKEHLEKYQTVKGNLDADVTMTILNIVMDGDNLILQGSCYDVLLNTDFCSEAPEIGDRIRFSHLNTHRYIDGRKILFGVLRFTVISKTLEEARINSKEEKISETDLSCPCLRGGSCLLSENFDLQNYFVENLERSISISSKDDSLRSIPSSPSNILNNVSVSKLVEVLGGTSSSPQNSFSLCRKLKFSSEFLIHRIFFQRKPTNIEKYSECSPSLLCEDSSGEFVLVKLDSALRKDENWRIIFGENWESMMGQRITLWSPYHIQNRFTRSQNVPLFSTISSIRETNQRFCYVFKVFVGSKFDIGVEAKTNIKILDDLPSISGDSRRVNLNSTVIYITTDKNDLYILPASNPSSYLLITARKSFVHDKFFKTDTVPCRCVIVGLVQESCGNLSLDGFSSIIILEERVELDLAFLPGRSGSSKVGDLVKIQGMVTRVDQQASLQWMECDVCSSDEVKDEPGGGWRCLSCNQLTGARHKIELVCRVGSWWVRLSNSAKKILPTDNLDSFHPADVIGQVSNLVFAVLIINLQNDIFRQSLMCLEELVMMGSLRSSRKSIDCYI